MVRAHLRNLELTNDLQATGWSPSTAPSADTIGHLDLLSSPEVYAKLLSWLSPRDEAKPSR